MYLRLNAISTNIFDSPDPENPWACTGYTETGLFRTEVARYAFNYLRDDLDPIDGKQFGMLVMDSCGNKLRTAGIVYDILRGSEEICDQQGQCLNSSTIAAFIGDYSSAVTEQVSVIRCPELLMIISAWARSLFDFVAHLYHIKKER